MKYVVTGGNGFIGSHIVDKLIDEGHEVSVIDDLSAEAHEQFYFNSKAENHRLDISTCNLQILENIIDGASAVFHLAAESRIQPCIENPTGAVRTNIQGTCNVLQAARSVGTKRIIFSSSSSVYGLKSSIPSKESDIVDCLNVYSVSKYTGEQLCKIYSELYGMETVCLRYFNVYGPRQPLKGQYAPVVGLFLRQYANGEPLTVVGDGNQRRDFTHVSDVVAANISFANIKESGWLQEESKHWKWNWGEVFNVGTGINYSINEIASLFVDYPIINLPARPGEARVSKANISKIKSATGWFPQQNLHDYMINEINNI